VSSRAVSEEVDALRKKLEQRQKVHDVPAEVERARSEVVRCLRENDRRPLDCWREVEAFKSQVRSLEEAWVKKVMD
jgi:MICOS complex subunit MIC19